MSELGTRMELIKTLFAVAYPLRIVTRDLLPFDQRKAADLQAGIWTIIGNGERDYANYSGREGMDGRQPLLMVAQFVMPEGTAGSAIEEMEFTLVEEVKTFLRDRLTIDPRLAQLFMLGFRQSQQLDAPYGWVSIDLEFLE
jgi:hypothetical protein